MTKIWCVDYSIFTDAEPCAGSEFPVDTHEGRSYADDFSPNAAVAVRSRKRPTDFFKAGMLWIISSKLKEVLVGFGAQVEYLPVAVVTRKGDRIEPPWYCMNVTLLIDWFDRDMSRFKARAHVATRIESLVVREEMLAKAPLAAAKDTIPILIAVSDTLADAVVAAGCTGVRFCDPKDWKDPRNPTV